MQGWRAILIDTAAGLMTTSSAKLLKMNNMERIMRVMKVSLYET